MMEPLHKHLTMMIHQEARLNVGPSLSSLRQSHIMPGKYFFVGNYAAYYF